jgi:hypothetical protein
VGCVQRTARRACDANAKIVVNESVEIIRGKDFTRSARLWTRFQAGRGNDKAIGSLERRQRAMTSARTMARGNPACLASDPHDVMHLQIVEADKQLTQRYVANGPHCWTMRIKLTERRSAGGTDQAAVCYVASCSGLGANATLEYWIDRRRIRAAPKAPWRHRPCRSRALPVDRSFFVSRRLHRRG